MHKFKHNKGDAAFTIIELIVVIAIIAILAAIVLVNVTQYVSKAQDAAAVADAAQVPVLAADFSATNNGFSGFCGSPNMLAVGKAIGNISKAKYSFSCFDATSCWSMSAPNGTILSSGCSIALNSPSWVANAAQQSPSCSGLTGQYVVSVHGPNGYFCVDASGVASSGSGNASGYSSSGKTTNGCNCL